VRRELFSGFNPDDDDDDDDDDDGYDGDDGDDDISEMTDFSVPAYKKVLDAMNINALEKEVVNVKFITQSLEESFSTLTKTQKNKLKTLCELILTQMYEIVFYYPEDTKIYDQVINVFDMLADSIWTIEDRLKQAGEGVLNYEGGGRVNRGIYNLHQPSKYVNANWSYNLAQRNN
jgi:uncharacterized protein YsxB (DUF464 family)